MKKWLISGRAVIISCAIFLLFSAVIFYLAAHISIMHGIKIIDAYKCGYSPTEAYDILTKMGNSGRKTYSLLNKLDFVYPFTYSIFLALCIGYISQKLFPLYHPLQKLCLFPFLACVTDLGENIYIFKMLKDYPYISAKIAKIASYFTVAKWIFIRISILILVALFSIQLYEKFFRKTG